MEFRIVKTKARPEYSYPYKYHGVDWFIVQYKDEPSLWNLWHPSWKNLKYNQQEFLEYNSITNPKLVSICNSIKEYVNNDPYLSDLKKSGEKKVETRSKAKILVDKFTELLK